MHNLILKALPPLIKQSIIKKLWWANEMNIDNIKIYKPKKTMSKDTNSPLCNHSQRDGYKPSKEEPEKYIPGDLSQVNKDNIAFESTKESPEDKIMIKENKDYEPRDVMNVMAELEQAVCFAPEKKYILLYPEELNDIREQERTKVIKEIRLEIASYSKLGVEQTKYLLDKLSKL